MKRLMAFLKGMREARQEFCTGYKTWVENNAYDCGRQLAQRLGL